MQRKQEFENEVHKILKDYPSDTSKRDVTFILEKISQDTILTAQEKINLLIIQKYKGTSAPAFAFLDSKNIWSLLDVLTKPGMKDQLHEFTRLIIKLHKELSSVHFAELTINKFITQNHFDVIYLSLINNLIQPNEYPLISKAADPLVNYIFQMGHADKWQAFEYAFKQDHPLHCVLKSRNDLLERMRKAIHDNDMPPPSYVPPAPTSRPGYIIQPDLYPPLQNIGFYSVGAPNTVLFDRKNSSACQNNELQEVLGYKKTSY